MEKWRDQWLEIHYAETQKQIARLAIEKAERKREWWEEFNCQPETD